MLLHVGYHKTATTWLQRHLFANAAAGFASPWSFDEVIDQLVRPHPLAWDEASVRARITERLASGADAGLVPVISNEELAGNPHSGAFNNTIIADRLARLFPDARILIVIREQRDLLVSMYKQYVRRGGVLSPRRYFRSPPDAFRMPAFRPGHLEFDRLIELYRDRFGADRVRVLAMEAMLEDRAAFLRAIAEHAGTGNPGTLPDERVRVSLSAAATSVQRRLNRLLLRDDVNPAAPFRVMGLVGWMARLDRMLAPFAGPLERGLRRVADDVARDRYEASNRRTAELTGLPLDRYGYAS